MTAADRGALLRVLGIAFGVAAVVGGMVGQGILRTPGIVAGAVGTPQPMLGLWFAGALVVAISAFAYTELGSAIPCAGGPFDWASRAFGRTAGLVTGWAAWLTFVTGQAMLSVVAGEFLVRLGVFPEMGPNWLALAVLALFWAVNWTGTRISGGSQIVFSAIKGAALIALVILLLAQPAASQPSSIPTTELVGIGALAMAMRVIIGTYNGWQELAFYCEDLKEPQRTLPRAMAAGVISVAALYLLVNVALLHVLSPAQMASSNLPAADAAALALGASGEMAMTLFGVLSVAAITNLKMMGSARIGFALGRAGILPSPMARVSASGTPRVALTVTAILSAIVAFTGTYISIITTQIALYVALTVMVNCSAIALRRREPSLERSFRTPLHPLPELAAILINLLLLAAFIFEDPLYSLAGFVALGAIAVLYVGAGHSRVVTEAVSTRS